MYNLFLAICTQRCRNGGRCIAPDQCSCRAGWDGPDCSQGTVFQLELWELCASILLLTLQLCAHHHARMEIAWDQASVNVSLGGLGSVVSKVKSQSYLPVPNHIPWTQLIFFKTTAICSPTCKNGGECTHPGHCSCGSDWTGPTCQQRIYV